MVYKIWGYRFTRGCKQSVVVVDCFGLKVSIFAVVYVRAPSFVGGSSTGDEDCVSLADGAVQTKRKHNLSGRLAQTQY